MRSPWSHLMSFLACLIIRPTCRVMKRLDGCGKRCEKAREDPMRSPSTCFGIRSPGSWEPSVHAAVVLALFKKGDRAKLDNYRGICLLSVASRVVARVISCRLRDHTEAVGTFRCDQWGSSAWPVHKRCYSFCSSFDREQRRGCAIRVLWTTCVCLCWTLRKRTPVPPRNAAWRILQNEGVPAHVINLLQQLAQ